MQSCICEESCSVPIQVDTFQPLITQAELEFGVFQSFIKIMKRLCIGYI